MLISDAALPAAAHLVGPGAIDLLRVPVMAAGGEIEAARACNVQYRPGSDVTVRYTVQVSWNGEPPARETLVAATTSHGNHPGAVAVTAATPAGRLDVGVWRWPFDPVLTGLDDAVRPSSVARLLGTRSDVELEVVAYRPTDRVVVRAHHDDRTSYLKVVAPHLAEGLVERHTTLRDVGVPAPRVRDLDDRGIVVLDELEGTTFREHIKEDSGVWPTPAAFDELADAFAAAALDGSPTPAKVTDGILHASMLAAVMPEQRARLDALASRLRRVDAGQPVTVHGDLHEGQLIVRDGAIVGVLDIDDAGEGDPADDRANIIAHLRYRAVTTPALRRRLDKHADLLRWSSAGRFDLDHLDVTTAAALVGLATGPFRIQQPGWRERVDDLLAEAERIAALGGRTPSTRRGFSSGPHHHLTDVCP